MVRRPAGRWRIDAIEPEVAEFQRIHEHIDRASRIALADPIIEALRQQRRLLAIRPLNETLHHFPRRFSKRIIASMGFSHSLGQKRHSDHAPLTSGLPRIADIFSVRRHVSKVPNPEISAYWRHPYRPDRGHHGTAVSCQ